MTLHRSTILLVAVALFCLTGCRSSRVDPEFISTDDFCLKVKETVLFSYDPLTCQVAFNREKNEFRVHTDDMSDWYCVTLSGVPSGNGDKLTGSITWTTSSSVESSKGLSFVVKKNERDGKVWLWCKKERIGVVVQVLD